jgi:putative two-component system response regulator
MAEIPTRNEDDESKILIVEDEPLVCRTLERIVSRVGRQCLNVSSAEEALQILEKETFDLILSDICLPGESGIKLMAHLGSRYPETAVIMVSGMDDADIVEKALELGAYGYIVKPFRTNEVIISVSSALRRQRLEAESRRHRENLEQMVQSRTASLMNALDGVVKVITRTIDARDPYTAGHQLRVADLACAIAEKVGMDGEQVKGLRMAGMLHDLGKISVPAEILSKPTRLTDLEFSLVKTHAQTGYDILEGLEFPWPVATMVHQHHEKLDGSGYPLGVKGDAILPESRILCIADVMEAMASHRPYRPALGLERALEEISGKAGILYDRLIAETCTKLFREGSFSF